MTQFEKKWMEKEKQGNMTFKIAFTISGMIGFLIAVISVIVNG